MPHRLRALVLTPYALLAAPAGLLPVQEVIHVATGDVAWLGHGFSVAVAGDVDGDGVDDYWAGAPDLAGAGAGHGRVRLVSGADGTVLHEIGGQQHLGRFGFALASGRDLDGDGVAEVAIGMPRGHGVAPEAGTVWVRRFATSRHLLRADAPLVLYRLRGRAAGDRFGEALCFVDDTDGDGVAELLVGAPGDDVGGTDSGSVRIVSGASGATLGTLRGALGSELGASVADAGDLDGDGHNEMLVGAPRGGGASGIPGAGQALVVSGATGLTLATLQGSLANGRFGLALAAMGDADGDGVGDIAVGAPRRDYARVYSGVDRTLLWEAAFSAVEPTNYAPLGVGLEGGFGRALCGVGDQNGDGRDDLAIGYPEHSSVHIHSGADGARLELLTSAHQISSVSAPILGVYFGYALARVADRNGDGRSDLAVGAPFDFQHAGDNYDVGAVAVVSVATDPVWVREVRAISGAGDVDGDGLDDVAYGYASGIEISSGADGALLRSLPGVIAHAMRAAGDVDGDGVEDLVVGNRAELANRGRVRVFSGADGAVLHDVTGDAPGDRFGTSVDGLGDLDGDGCAEFAAGAPLSQHPAAEHAAGHCELDPGYVRIYSGQSGALLFELEGEGLPGGCPFDYWSEAFGFSLAGIGDWNEDGTPDVAVGAPGAASYPLGEVRIFSGADGALLAELVGIEDGEFGISVDGGPDFDLDADGRVDVVVGEQLINYTLPTRGWAHVFSSVDGSRLATFTGTPTQGGYSPSIGPAYSVAALADFDLDGHSDVVLGNPAAPGPLGPGVGEALIFSGADGSLLESLVGTSSWDYLGYSVVAAGDVDGDGASDALALALPSLQPSAYSRARPVLGTVP